LIAKGSPELDVRIAANRDWSRDPHFLKVLAAVDQIDKTLKALSRIVQELQDRG
jgi:hypothetical protein